MTQRYLNAKILFVTTFLIQYIELNKYDRDEFSAVKKAITREARNPRRSCIPYSYIASSTKSEAESWKGSGEKGKAYAKLQEKNPTKANDFTFRIKRERSQAKARESRETEASQETPDVKYSIS